MKEKNEGEGKGKGKKVHLKVRLGVHVSSNKELQSAAEFTLNLTMWKKNLVVASFSAQRHIRHSNVNHLHCSLTFALRPQTCVISREVE